MALTKKEEKLLNFVLDLRNWRPPSYPQMRKEMKVKSNQSIFDFLKNLEKKGYLRKRGNKITIL